MQVLIDGQAGDPTVGMGMKRSTHYAMQAWSPWRIGDLVALVGRIDGGHMEQLVRGAVKRAGDLFVPITTVLRVLPDLPNEIRRQLYDDLIWEAGFHNLVTTVGLNDSLAQHFKGSSYTAAWYVGLTASSPTFAAGDTASSHTGWTELTAYNESVRQTLTLGSVSGGSVDNSASKAVFTINADSTTIGGAFLITGSTKSGTTGTLYGGGALSTGNKTLDNGDVLNVTLTLTAS